MIVRSFDRAVEDFIESLETVTIAKVLHIIELLRIHGHTLRMPYSKSIGGRLYELRVRGTQEVRIFYAFHEDSAILLHGFVKKSQKVPRKEIMRAQERFRVLT